MSEREKTAKLILASKSPRRKDILSAAGFTFSVLTCGGEEVVLSSPEETAKKNAQIKARAVFNSLLEEEKSVSVVLGADTVVYFNGEILGKPKDSADAVSTLKKLSGNVHEVFTGYCVISADKETVGSVKTEVFFNTLTDQTINEYVKTALPLDKAGSYGIQDGYSLIEKISGSRNNVIGLPIEEIAPILNKALAEI